MKYGFVYIWFDRKRRMYYIGCHWGIENDGYVCSSHRMLDNYRRRPQDFKRRILERVDNRKDLFWSEACWLWFIEPKKLGKKYYNNCRTPIHHWSANEQTKLSTAKKISKHHKEDPNWGQWMAGREVKEETRENLRQANKEQFKDPKQREMRRQKSLELWADPEWRARTTKSHRDKKPSIETRQKMRVAAKDKPKPWLIGKPSWNKGLTKDTDERVAKTGNRTSGATRRGHKT
jgi:hypothetical protein